MQLCIRHIVGSGDRGENETEGCLWEAPSQNYKRNNYSNGGFVSKPNWEA